MFFFGAWAWSKTLDCYRLPVFVTFVPFVETNFCLNSPSRPWWIWANCLLHASYQLPVAQHHAWPIKNWQNWCGTANIDSWRFLLNSSRRELPIIKYSCWWKHLWGKLPRQPNLDLLCWCFSTVSKQPSIPFLGHLRTLRRSKMPEEDLLMRSTQAKTIAAESRFKAVRVWFDMCRYFSSSLFELIGGS